MANSQGRTEILITPVPSKGHKKKVIDPQEDCWRVTMSNVAKPVGPGPVLLTELPKRKRGRPRKQPQEPVGPSPPKKPRGRPRGSKKLSAKSGQGVHAAAEKRPRGRPRKWLVVQEEEYPKACVQESGNSSSNAHLTTEDTSGKSYHRINRTTEFKRQLSTSPAGVQQQPAC